MKNNSMVTAIGSIDLSPVSRHQSKSNSDGPDSDVTSGSGLPLPLVDTNNTNTYAQAEYVVDSNAGDVLSRMINNENYKKIIASKGRVQFPSYIVSTIQH